jgi:hypothetical protein
MNIAFLRRPQLSAVLSTVLSCVLFSGQLPAAPPTPKQPHAETLRLHVFDSEEEGPISGANVRLLSRAGLVLAEATTDESGVAVLPQVSAALNPSMILVEHEAFYIGGLRWRPGYQERCVHLAIGRTCCLQTVQALKSSASQ